MILDLAESGLSNAEIAQRAKLAPKYVYQVVSQLLAPKKDDWQSSARLGSQSLLAAIRRHHPERFAPAIPSTPSPSHSIPGSAGAASACNPLAAQPSHERAA